VKFTLCKESIKSCINDWLVKEDYMSHEFEFRYKLCHRGLEEAPHSISESRRAYIERVLREYQAVSKGLMEAKKIRAPFYWEEILFRIR
jgi:hypothetical protein